MVSPRNLPLMAEYGWSLIFFVLLAVVLFLVPVSLAIAELATTWPRRGGVYPWVREAFRGRAGFLAVWCDWAENLAWFPTVLAFTATSFAYAFDPDLANNKVFLVVVMLAVFWGATLAAFRGVGRDERDRGDRHGAGRHRAGAPDHGAGGGLPRRRQRLRDPLLRRRADPEPGHHQPGVPDRRDPHVRRHGGGRLPRRPGAPAGPRLPPGHPAGGRDHDRLHDPRLAGARGGRPPARDQPGGRRHAGVPGRVRRPRGGVAAACRRPSSSPSAGSRT